MAYFNSVREGVADKLITMSGKEQAVDFLDGAARHRQSVLNIETTRLTNARKSGSLDKSTTDDSIKRYMDEVAYLAQAKSIVDNPPTRGGMEFMKNQVDMAQHKKGTTYTSGYGDMRSSAAKQRASNTRLKNEESLHGLDDDMDALDDKLGGELKKQQATLTLSR